MILIIPDRPLLLTYFTDYSISYINATPHRIDALRDRGYLPPVFSVTPCLVDVLRDGIYVLSLFNTVPIFINALTVRDYPMPVFNASPDDVAALRVVWLKAQLHMQRGGGGGVGGGGNGGEGGTRRSRPICHNNLLQRWVKTLSGYACRSMRCTGHSRE